MLIIYWQNVLKKSQLTPKQANYAKFSAQIYQFVSKGVLLPFVAVSVLPKLLKLRNRSN